MRTCTTCHKKYPLTEFYKNNARADGLTTRCKACSRANKRKHGRKANLKKRYNLSTEEYEYMSFKQGHKCAICDETSDKKLSVDHDHKTEVIRGLLCNTCNTALGQFKDDPTIILKAYNYLTIHNHNQQQQKGNK